MKICNQSTASVFHLDGCHLIYNWHQVLSPQRPMQQLPDDKSNSENQYFKLIQTVGTRGCYQTLLIVFTIILCIPNGIISLGSSYNFAVPSYTECPPPHAGISLCTQYACSLPPHQRQQYQQKQIKELNTIGTEFGDYHCDRRDAVEQAKGTYFLGAITGFVIVGLMADNVGRRLSIMVCLGVGAVGYMVMLMSVNLTMAGVGHFLVGFSTESSFNLVFCLLAQMLQNNQREKMQTFIQAWIPLGAIILVLAFKHFREWKLIFFFLCFLPIIFAFFFSCFYIVDTPLFLVKCLEVEEIRENLRFIARINGREEEFEQSERVSYNQIAALKKQYNEEISSEHNVSFTFLDLFRYPSLRSTTIVAMVFCFTANVIYYIPQMLIDQIGFDFYLNGIIVNSSDLTTYLFTFLLITQVKRRPLMILSSTVSLVTSFALIFVQQCHSSDCDRSGVMEMVLIFGMRCAGAILNQIMYIYIAELFPMQVRGMGFGMSCIFGQLPNAFLPELIHLMNKANFPVMILSSLVSLISMVASWAGPETFGQQPKEQVEEIHRGEHLHSMSKQKFRPVASQVID